MKNEKPLDAEEINLITLAQKYSDEDSARALLESWRWPNGPVCPHCKFNEVYKIVPKSGSKTRKGVYCCSACRKQFTATVGTIFEGSHIPISKWLMAIFMVCSSKKSISSHQLHRMLGITYKSAWFMTHRIRYAMGPDMPLGKMLTGEVEVDETFVGGKGDSKGRYSRQTPVVALIQRDGPMQARVISNVTQKNLGQVLGECVDKGAVVNTDQHVGYVNPLKDWKEHRVVNHSKFEYSRKNPDGTVAGVNFCESYFSLFKRAFHGAWHHVSKEHLPKYSHETAFRWNHRKTTDGERTAAAVRVCEGKRLTYKPLIALRFEQKEKQQTIQRPKRIFREPAP